MNAATEIAETTAGITIRDLGKQFTVSNGTVVALQDVTVDIPAGSFVSLIGPSGCGKSTLLRMIADLLQPTSGAITIGDRTPQQVRLGRELGMVFQSPNLLPWRTVLANVALPLEVTPTPKRERLQLAQQMIELVGLQGFEQHLPRQLSGGMQQRVSIARALTTSPQVLLMDEPFGALDEITRDRLNLELLQIWERVASTVVFVTHSIAEAVFLSTRVVVLAARPGRVVDVIDIDLPQPRTAPMRDQPHFHEHVHRIREGLATGSES